MALDPASNAIRSCFVPFMPLGRYDRALDFIRSDVGSAWAANAADSFTSGWDGEQKHARSWRAAVRNPPRG